MLHVKPILQKQLRYFQNKHKSIKKDILSNKEMQVTINEHQDMRQEINK